MLGVFQVNGICPVVLHDVAHWVSHKDCAWVMLPTCIMPEPNIVITTSAVIRMTIAATTTVSVMFTKTPQVIYLCLSFLLNMKETIWWSYGQD